MVRLRFIPAFRAIQPTHTTSRAILPSIYAQQHRLYAGSSYGSGEGDPKGENPQEQGPNPSASLEHPGPAPPDVGQGTGGGPTKKGAEGHNTQQSPSSGNEGSSSPQPKIHQHNAPGEENHSDEVRAHNEDMKRRHDRAEEKSPDEEDKVDKSFWKGRGGADRNP